jgi:hypothetical protein
MFLTPVTSTKDITLDCAIDQRDLLLLPEHWGPVTTLSLKRADVDGDGVVDGYDLVRVLAAWSPKGK